MNSRWFVVVADGFDFQPKQRVFIHYRKGLIGYGNKALFDQAGSKVKRIARPKGYRVDKAGRVVKDA